MDDARVWARQFTRVARAKKTQDGRAVLRPGPRSAVCRYYGVDGGVAAVVAAGGAVESAGIDELDVDSVESLDLPEAQAARDIVATTKAVAVRVRSVAFMEVL
ncbi:hypothetical protein LVB87_03075 [Lysobacter sp. KIS68-7]|uniref:hypothetical protein n=1 Tax=Lysobacter sp. KIS68-7 TaxID=2904252 RepID=UPI001E590982|nr:hypothetical protein [Lysobacter sp. KIS68-7]UHQ20158.1 hypothetical protein LVB87_03075 [Lysobacter sp. KIS68-7]